MASESHRLSSTERANLVAYLDGELDETEAQVLAERLTQSVTGRREIEMLQATWELLDHLPRPQASPDLLERTLTQIAQAEAPEARWGGALAGFLRRTGRWALLAGCCLASAAITHVGVRWIYPDPTAALARDLTIAERLEMYEAVGTMEFLRALDESTLLDAPSPR